MKRYWIGWLLAIAWAWPEVAGARLELLPGAGPQHVFAGMDRKISVTFSNSANETEEARVRVRVLQTTSSTAAEIGARPWKDLEVLPGQAVLESAQLDFPAVNAETRFLVEWVAGTGQVIGQTEVRVYPTNLLAELKPMTDGQGPGVFDPQNELKPLLRNLRVDFTDLEYSGLNYFSGRLAIVGPFASREQMRGGLPAQIKALAKKNVAVVWLLPPPEKKDKLAPSFYSIMEGTNAVVLAQAGTVSRLADSPQAQMNLIYFCRLALKPAPMLLPEFSSQP